MAKGFKHGAGGSQLNFKVESYATEELLKADTPKENTIGVITTTDIPRWVFSATEPSEPEVGMVWILVGNSSTTEFNALKKNTLQVYPISANQYVDGTWKEIIAMSYQGGKWVSWTDYLYEPSNQHTDLTGGWSNSGWSTPYSGFSAKAPTIDETSITLTSTSDKQFPAAGTAKKVDLSKYKTLYATVDSVSSGMTVFLAVNSEKKVWNDSDYPMTARKSVTKAGEIALSVGNVSSAYVVVFAYSESGTKSAKISSIWME